MSDGLDLEKLQQELTEAFEKVLARYDNSQITKWVALVEVITLEDGERGLWSLASKTSMVWDVKGMLRHALDLEQAQSTVRLLRGDDD